MAILLTTYVFLMFGVLSTSSSWPILETYELYDWCNATKKVHRAVLLEARGKVTECKVRIQASTNYKFSISYDQIDEHVDVIFCQNSIEIFLKNYLNKDTDCRKFPNLGSLISLSDILTISLHGDVSLQDNVTEHDTIGTGNIKDFRLLLVPYHTGECTYQEFHCSNDRCVDSQLRCHPGYFTCASDNCFDGDFDPADAIIIAVIAIGALVIILCIVGCSCWCYQNRKKRSRTVSTEMRDVASYQPTQANIIPMLTPPPYSPPSDPPPYSINPEQNDQFALQREICDKEREVTQTADTEREVTSDDDMAKS